MNLCCFSLPRPRFRSCGVGQCFEVTTNSPLVFLRQASVLFDQDILHRAQRIASQSGSYAGEYVRNVKAKIIGDSAQVRGSGVTGARLPIGLGPFGNSKRFGDLELGQPAPLPLFLESGAYFFRKMHFFSSLVFTSAPKCIIVHLTPHEIARICTMPNSSITEQARQKAREALEKRGQSVKDFAVKHQLNPSTVYAVLSGQSHCRRGEAHRAAVLLGIKEGVIAQ